MGLAAGIISILDWLKGKLPIADRLEKIKNDIDKLEREKYDLFSKPFDAKKSARLVAIDKQLDILRVRLQNATGTS